MSNGGPDSNATHSRGRCERGIMPYGWVNGWEKIKILYAHTNKSVQWDTHGNKNDKVSIHI